MGMIMRSFIIILFIALLLGSSTPISSQAQDIRINPLPPKVVPQWTRVPGAPGVFYAPNIPTDVFKYKGRYYFFWEGYFYKSKSPKGPWKTTTKPPDVFYKINPGYFKTVKPEAPAVPTPPVAPAIPPPALSPPPVAEPPVPPAPPEAPGSQ
jgi:hypothetical protein